MFIQLLKRLLSTSSCPVRCSTPDHLASLLMSIIRTWYVFYIMPCTVLLLWVLLTIGRKWVHGLCVQWYCQYCWDWWRFWPLYVSYLVIMVTLWVLLFVGSSCMCSWSRDCHCWCLSSTMSTLLCVGWVLQVSLCMQSSVTSKLL